MSLKGAICKLWGAVKFLVSIVFNVYFFLGVGLYLAITAAYEKYNEIQSPYKYSVPENAVVSLSLGDEPMNETSIYGTPAARWENLLKNSRGNRYSFSEQVYALSNAASDDKVKGVVVKLNARQYNSAQAYEITQALLNVRNAGKPVYVLVNGAAANNDLLILSAATKRYVVPGSFVRPVRPSYGAVFNKGFYDKFKIDFIGQRVSLYKDMILDDVKYQVDQDVKSTYDTYYTRYLDTMKGIGENYNRPYAEFDLSDEQLLTLFKEYKGDFAAGFTAKGWFDKVVTESEFDSLVAKEVAGRKTNAKVPNYFSLAAYTSATNKPLFDSNASSRKPHIAYVTMVGDVTRSSAGAPDVISINNTLRYLRSIYYNANNVQAVVLRIDSPGGSSNVGITLRQALDDIRAKGIPVVVSQGYLAASAGYMLSSGSDYIYTTPLTITGSIGVVITGYNLNRFLGQFDIKADAIGPGRYYSLVARLPIVQGYANPHGDAVAELWKAGITNSYHEFISQVYEGRKDHFASLEEVNRVSQGHTWSGSDAKALGLVDGFGGVSDAINKAREFVLFAQEKRETDEFSRGEFTKVAVEELDKLPVIYYNAGRRYSITGSSLVSRVLSSIDYFTDGYLTSALVTLDGYLNSNKDELLGTYQARLDTSDLDNAQGQK
ncbi:S49 family peptidase [Psittacicella hinzii]|uniref:Peptidase S49 domain-containing protein n=1 Tax=Psittacicella hinzii TaxID=2028575 RepID=A0A3A1YHG5_9GAMM|nr:S49 family peptidase [Psittacicella hinzii]RIY35477.1 hypothetical protein CKF58_06675 [Psittacicella hinzii]